MAVSGVDGGWALADASRDAREAVRRARERGEGGCAHFAAVYRPEVTGPGSRRGPFCGQTRCAPHATLPGPWDRTEPVPRVTAGPGRHPRAARTTTSVAGERGRHGCPRGGGTMGRGAAGPRRGPSRWVRGGKRSPRPTETFK